MPRRDSCAEHFTMHPAASRCILPFRHVTHDVRRFFSSLRATSSQILRVFSGFVSILCSLFCGSCASTLEARDLLGERLRGLGGSGFLPLVGARWPFTEFGERAYSLLCWVATWMRNEFPECSSLPQYLHRALANTLRRDVGEALQW